MSNFLKNKLAKVLTSTKKTPPPPRARRPACLKKNGPDPAVTETLLAWTAPQVNRTLLVAYKPGADPTNPSNLISVRVRSNHNFLPHMKLRVQHIEGTIYNLVGPLPRGRGRW